MFIKVTQSGNRRYAQLVESFRNEQGKPRQRTVCTLGRIEAGGEVDTLIASLQRARGRSPAKLNSMMMCVPTAWPNLAWWSASSCCPWCKPLKASRVRQLKAQNPLPLQ
jgi:hypothetical protein